MSTVNKIKGWGRATDLAKGRQVSFDVVKRINSFIKRHKENAKINPKYKNEPWKDNGYLMMLAWGEDGSYKALNWTQNIIDKNENLNENEIIEEGIISVFNTGVALYLIKLLTTRWQNWDAYKFGLIDDKGNRTEKQPETKQEKDSLSLIHKFVIGLRRMLLTVMSESILKILVAVYVVKNIKD
jgi:hypothetical protein